MSVAKILGIVLIAVGVLGLAYGGFTYAGDTQELSVGSMSMSVTERRTFAPPMWAGIAVLLVGGALMFVPASKS
jgi:hypothetical protein